MCGYCGSTMIPHYTQERKSKREPHNVYYYRCTGTMHYRNSACEVRHINAIELERLVIDHLAEISQNETYLKKSAAEINEELKKQTKPLEKEAILYRKRLDEINLRLTIMP